MFNKLLFALVLIASAAPLLAQPAFSLKPRAFPLITTTIYGTTGTGQFTNTSLNGNTFLSTNTDGTTGLPIVSGYALAVAFTYSVTNGISMTNGPVSVYFAPSIGGTNFGNSTNNWLELVCVPTGNAAITTNRTHTTNFSATILAGYTHLHCVGFKSVQTNYMVNVGVAGSVPKN